MSSSFRIDESEVRAWHAALAERIELRGVAALAKEMEAHLARKDADGSVVVTRHQLFTWAEALQGAAARDPRASAAGAQLSLAQVVGDMRAILSGKAADAAPQATRIVPGPYNAVAETYRGAFEEQLEVTQQGRAEPPPVTYASAPSAAPTGRGGVRVVTGPEVGATVRDLVRAARGSLYVSSPWPTGVETLVADLVAVPKEVRMLMLSRRPERDDAAFHQAMDQLGRRRTVTAWSPFIQTRLVIQDNERALIGAASVPGPGSREVGVLVTDPAAIAALRAQFERAHEEAAGGKY